MSLDQRTIVLAQISAAVACNALATLRVVVTEALELGVAPLDIQEVLNLAKDIQQQPISHVTHLANQLLRDSKKLAKEHTAQCGCGCGSRHS